MTDYGAQPRAETVVSMPVAILKHNGGRHAGI